MTKKNIRDSEGEEEILLFMQALNIKVAVIRYPPITNFFSCFFPLDSVGNKSIDNLKTVDLIKISLAMQYFHVFIRTQIK